MLKKFNLRNTILTREYLNTRARTESDVVDVNAECVVRVNARHSSLEEDARTAFEFVDIGK